MIHLVVNGQGNNLGKTDTCKAEEVQIPKKDNGTEQELMCISGCGDVNICKYKNTAVNRELCGKSSEWTHPLKIKHLMEQRKYLQERLFLQMLLVGLMHSPGS